MADLWVVAGFVMFVFVIVFWAATRVKTQKGVDTPYIRGETYFYTLKYGLCYVLGFNYLPSGEDVEYRLLTEGSGVQAAVFKESDLMEPNKHLNIVSRPFIIEAAVIEKLAGKIDVTLREKAFVRLKREFEELQSQHKLLQANKDAEIQAEVDRMKILLEAAKPKGRMR